MGEMVFVVDALTLDLMSGLKKNSFSQDVNDLHGMNSALLTGCYLDRDEAEKRDIYKQVIPYIVLLASDGTYLCYQRTGSEGRLALKHSIGLGGHINPVDEENTDFSNDKIWNNMERELNEEVAGLDASALLDDTMCVGVLYDPSDDVGRVHIGLVYLAELDEEKKAAVSIKAEGKSLSWKTLDELKELSTLESWSRLYLGI